MHKHRQLNTLQCLVSSHLEQLQTNTVNDYDGSSNCTLITIWNHILDGDGRCIAEQLAQGMTVAPYRKTALHHGMTVCWTVILQQLNNTTIHRLETTALYYTARFIQLPGTSNSYLAANAAQHWVLWITQCFNCDHKNHAYGNHLHGDFSALRGLDNSTGLPSAL